MFTNNDEKLMTERNIKKENKFYECSRKIKEIDEIFSLREEKADIIFDEETIDHNLKLDHAASFSIDNDANPVVFKSESISTKNQNENTYQNKKILSNLQAIKMKRLSLPPLSSKNHQETQIDLAIK